MENMRLEDISKIQDISENGKYLCEIGKYSEAKKQFEKIIELDCNNIPALYSIVHCNYMLKQYDEVEKYCNKIIGIDKKQGRAYWILSIIQYQVKHNADKALNYINRSIYNGFDSPYIYNAKGIILEEQKKYEDAIKCYNRAVHINPLFYKARIRKAEIHLKLNRINDAIKCYDEIIINNPEITDGYHFKFLALMKNGDYKGANEVLENAIVKLGSEDIFINNQIQLYKVIYEFDKAIDLINKHYSTYNNKIDIMTEKAIILGMKGDIEQALNVISSLEKDKYTDKTIYCISNLYMKINDFENASKYLHKLIFNEKETSSYRYIALYEYPLSLKKQGKTEEAYKHFEIAMNEYKLLNLINPYDNDIKLFRALCLKQLEKYDEALDYIEYMLSIDDKLAEAYAIKGSIYSLKGDKSKADDYLERAKKINNNIRLEYFNN